MSFPRTALSTAIGLFALGVASSGLRAEVVVAAGHLVTLMTLSSVDPTCQANGNVQINVLEQPRGGYIQVTKTRAFPNFNALNTRSRCNTLKLPATRVEYQSAGNYLGIDTVTVEAIYPDGNAKRIRVAVSVRPVAAGLALAPLPQGPIGDQQPALPPKPHVRHAEAHVRAPEHHRCTAPCTGETPKPAETKPLLTPL